MYKSRKHLPFVVCLLLLFLIWSLGILVHNPAFAENVNISATTRISIYDQYYRNGVSSIYHTNQTYWDSELARLYNMHLNRGYISGRGCCLLSFAHAAQWFDGVPASGDRKIKILSALLKTNNNPPEATNAYASYLNNTYNLLYSNGNSVTEEKMMQVFDSGGVIVFSSRDSNGFHVAMSIGYREYNGVLYVYIVDSTCRSTLKRLPDKGISAKTWDFTGNMSSYASGNNQSGGHYWIPFSQFKNLNYYHFFTPKDPITMSEVPTISEATAPTSLSNNSSFGLRGTITCKYNITEIRGMIYNCSTNEMIFDIPVTPNSSSYTLGTSGELINNGLRFGDSRLNNSWCRYILKATYDKDGVSCEKYLLDRYFTVGNAVPMTLEEPGSFEFICDDEIRSGPSESYSLVQNCAKGTIVYAIGYELNSSNNMWLKLSDGNYVWSGDVVRLNDPLLVKEIHISTPEGPEDQDEICYGVDEGSKKVVLQAYAMPYDASNQDIIWTVSNPDILRLDSSEKSGYGPTVGYFTITGIGQTHITATSTDGGNVSRTILFGYYISNITMPTSKIELYVGDEWQVDPIIVPNIAGKEDLYWTSRNSEIANVDENGKITAISSGSTTITICPKLPLYSYVKPVSLAVNVIDIPINNPDFSLPAEITVIEDEAFYGNAARLIKLPEGLSSIGSKAFAYCPHLEGVYIPTNCSNIASDAFDGVENLIIYCQSDSYAEYYASQHPNINCRIVP